MTAVLDRTRLPLALLDPRRRDGTLLVLDPDKETWLPVRGYVGLYEVSDQGRVRSLERIVGTDRRRSISERVLVPATNEKYPTVSLWRGGESRTCRVHNLLLEAFIGPRPPGWHGCHRDDEGQHNNIRNLRWGTPSDNIRDQIANGNHVNARKQLCPRGHIYDEANTIIGKRSDGSTFRQCRQCWGPRGTRPARRTREPLGPSRFPACDCGSALTSAEDRDRGFCDSCLAAFRRGEAI